MATDSDALQELTEFVRGNERSLAGFAWRCLAVRGKRPDRGDVEDVLSDAYLVAATKLRQDPRLRVEHMGAWFRKILFFRCLRHASKWRLEGWDRLVDRLEEEDLVLETVWGSRQPQAELEQRLIVSGALEHLDPRSRTALELISEGYTSEEIAGQMGESSAGVRKIKSRALARLRSILLGGKS